MVSSERCIYGASGIGLEARNQNQLYAVACHCHLCMADVEQVCFKQIICTPSYSDFLFIKGLS